MSEKKKNQTPENTMTAVALLRAIESSFTEKEHWYALRVIHRAYFDEYTDATEMDIPFAEAFERIFELLFPSGESPDGLELEDFLVRGGLEK